MSHRILDEREHRRGLVLGLTLAEVLMLLLFLLLLGLGHRLSRLEQERKISARERDEIRLVLEAIRAANPTEARGLTEEGAKALASKLSWILRLEQNVPAVEGKLDAVGEVVEAAAKIDRDDPIAVLRRAQAALRKLDLADGSTDLVALEKKIMEVEVKLATIDAALTPPGKVDANDPKLIKRTLKVLEKFEPFLIEMTAGASANPKVTTGTLKGKHDWPPIITLSEAKGYFFESGRAELSAEFRSKLSTSVIEELLQIIKQYEVDIIEVIGHTDEQRLMVRSTSPDTTLFGVSTPSHRLVVRPSNLDAALIPFLSSRAGLERLAPSDNAGLGLARAASVVTVLLADQRLQTLKVLPLSGGQLIEVGDTLSTGRSPGSVMERRRIEIRARRADKRALSWQGRISPEPSLSPAKKF